MKNWIQGLLFLFFSTSTIVAVENPRVKIQTNHGDIILELFIEDAPVTVDNFLRYVNGAFYDGLIFHRVIRGFVIQSGGYDAEGVEKKTLPSIINESSQRFNNKKWTVAMAREEEPDTATSQFFINTKNNKSLNAKKGKDGYTVFGRVIKGINTVKAIEKVDVGPDMYLGKHRPVDDVIIIRARVIRD